MKKILILIFALFLSAGLYAKKVICVDGCNSGFVNNHEGYERSQMAVGDVIQVGGNLTTCLNMLMNGDELIIIAHGTGTGTGFIWGGITYTGFGGGAGQYPVPAGFGTLMNITVKFCSCWSARDPDGGGADSSLVDKIVAALGAGSAGSGFNDLATSRVCYTITGGTAVQRQAGIAALKANTAWMNNPPTNRPGPPAVTQQTAAQAIVGALPGGLTVMVTAYKEPVNMVAPPPAGNGANGCDCTGGEGCGLGTQDGIETEAIPTLSQWGLIILFLLLLTIGSVSIIRQKRAALITINGANLSLKTPLFNAEQFEKIALKSIPFIIGAIVIISIIEGGLFAKNIIGTIFSGLVISYLIHFVLMSEKLEE